MSTTFDTKGNVVSNAANSSGKNVINLNLSTSNLKSASIYVPDPNIGNDARDMECIGDFNNEPLVDNVWQLPKKSANPSSDVISTLKPKRDGYFAYKGFNLKSDGTLQCRDTVYKVGEIYNIDGTIAICESGFHYCDKLKDVFNYYSVDDPLNVFHKIQVLGEYSENANEDKKVTNSFKILEKVSFQEIAFEVMREMIEKIVNLQELYPNLYLTGSLALLLAGKLPFKIINSLDFVSPYMLDFKEFNAYNSGTLQGEAISYTLLKPVFKDLNIIKGDEVSINTSNIYSPDYYNLKSTFGEEVSSTFKKEVESLPKYFDVFIEPNVRFTSINIPQLNNKRIKVQIPEDIMKVKARLYFTNHDSKHKKDLLDYLIHN